MPLQSTSGAASYDGFGGGVAVEPVYVEQIFSTYLYTGNATARSITNNIDLSTKGGLTWIKSRNGAGTFHYLFDTARGATNYLSSNLTNAQATDANSLTAFDATGFTLGGSGRVNDNDTAANSMASWTFRKSPKFFDVVTYTGNGVAGRQIPHSLGSVPGCIIVKRTNAAQSWYVYHRSLGSSNVVYLNATDSSAANSAWNYTDPTSTHFSVSDYLSVNGIGDTYVAYIFAHDAGGFGLTGTDNVITCGSFTTDGSGNATVNLGYEPQWVLFRPTGVSNWYLCDSMRPFTATGVATEYLKPNRSDASSVGGVGYLHPTATGFSLEGSGPSFNCIYIAIRRGPMKVPTDATKVFDVKVPGTTTGDGDTGISFPPDFVFARSKPVGTWYANDKLRGLPGSNITSQSPFLSFNTTDSETGLASYPIAYTYGNSAKYGYFTAGAANYVYDFFKRAPSFFDEVCFDENVVNTAAIPHNLTVVPELAIYKKRSATSNWFTFTNLDFNKYLRLNTTDALVAGVGWAATSTTVNLSQVTGSATSVAYLFATCAGVSKVGSYTGTATTQVINCGFTAGARFVLIKRTDSTGDWYVWDSARGIVAGNDPYLLLNSTAAEVTGTDYVDTAASGFELSSTAPAAINASGGTYLFLAIA